MNDNTENKAMLVLADHLIPVKVLEQTAVAEASLSQLASKTQSYTTFGQDSPDRITMAKRLEVEQIRHLQLALTSAIQMQDTSEKISSHKEVRFVSPLFYQNWNIPIDEQSFMRVSMSYSLRKLC